MRKQNENYVDWDILNSQLKILDLQRKSLSQLESEERINNWLRERGYRIKGDRMVVHSIRLPIAQRQWLQKHPEATVKIRDYIITLMKEEQKDTMYTMPLCTDYIYNNKNVLQKDTPLCTPGIVYSVHNAQNIVTNKRSAVGEQVTNNNNDKFQDAGAMPPPPLFTEDSLKDSGVPISNNECSICNKPFKENDNVVPNKDGLFAHAECKP